MNAVLPIRSHAVVDYTATQLALIQRTVAKDTNRDEFDLFMEVCRRTRLDPFRKQIHALVFNKTKPDKRSMSIVTGIDGFRAIAARTGRYRPDEEEADYVYEEALKSPANPLGILKATVTIWIADAMREGGWKPVKGWAYWEEFAPLKEQCSEGWEWVESGEYWEDSGKPKKQRVAKGEIIQVLDTSGNWPKMPRVMIAKCAEAQAIRKAFPEDASGIYEFAELDRAKVVDITASELIDGFQEEMRLKRVGAANTITFQMSPTTPLEHLPLGQVTDRVIAAARDWDLQQLRWFMDANRLPLQEFWARAQSDALGLKQELEKASDRLMEEVTA